MFKRILYDYEMERALVTSSFVCMRALLQIAVNTYVGVDRLRFLILLVTILCDVLVHLICSCLSPFRVKFPGIVSK